MSLTLANARTTLGLMILVQAGWLLLASLSPALGPTRVATPLEVVTIDEPAFQDKDFDIRETGAEPGERSCTEAINRAIKECHNRGGGRVVIPSGRWKTGAIQLMSNVNLHLAEGAELHFSDSPQDYLPVVFTRWAGFELYNFSPLIYAKDCENIAVTGPGRLFGHGEKWWKWKASRDAAEVVYQDYILNGKPPTERVFGRVEDGLRPPFIAPINCRRVLLEGFSVESPGPFWTINLTYCSSVIVRGLRINAVGGPNTDGVNLDSSRNVLVEDCEIRSGDDCITLKSGVNEDGRRVARPTENIVIRRCRTHEGHGGVVIGSEMSGGVRNVLVEDCEFVGTDNGLRIKSNKSRGGFVEDITYRKIKMRGVKQDAIQISVVYNAYLPDKLGDSPPLLRRLVFSEIDCQGAQYAFRGVGIAERPLSDITLKDVRMTADQGMQFHNVNGLVLERLKLNIKNGSEITLNNCRDIFHKKPTE